MSGVHLGARGGLDQDALHRLRELLPLPALLIVVAWSSPTLHTFAAGIAIAFGGGLIRFWAAGYLHADALLEFQAPRLVTAGPYAYMRNPLYAGNLLIALGFCVVANWWPAFLLCFWIYSYIYSAVIPHEEEALARAFGDAYARYKREVPRLRPRFRPYDDAAGRFSPGGAIKSELVTWTAYWTAVILFAIKLVF